MQFDSLFEKQAIAYDSSNINFVDSYQSSKDFDDEDPFSLQESL